MRIFLVLALTLTGFFAHSADAPQTHALMTPEEQEIHNRAKKRLYPGGRDEEPLKVLPQLVAPTRKMGPATEAPEAEHEDSAND